MAAPGLASSLVHSSRPVTAEAYIFNRLIFDYQKSRDECRLLFLHCRPKIFFITKQGRKGKFFREKRFFLCMSDEISLIIMSADRNHFIPDSQVLFLHETIAYSHNHLRGSSIRKTLCDTFSLGQSTNLIFNNFCKNLMENGSSVYLVITKCRKV